VGSLLGNETERLFGHQHIGDIASQIADELEHGTVAVIDAADIDAALHLVTLATDLLRVFQRVRYSTYRTTMFGLPGQLYQSNVRYLTAGDVRGPGFHCRGEVLGWTFGDQVRTAWLSSPAFTSVAALVGGDDPLDEGHRRALLGVQLLSQAILEHRPPFKILNLVIALESMLLERLNEPQMLRLLRRVTSFTCGRPDGSLCGRDRPACQLLALDPRSKTDRQQLDKLRKLAERDVRWGCSEWFKYCEWYGWRSSIAHGDDTPVTAEDVSKAEYWILRWTAEPVLLWLVEHPVAPLAELDEALADLEPVPDWQNPIPDPDPYEPGSYELG
jgi:hypothetical protein